MWRIPKEILVPIAVLPLAAAHLTACNTDIIGIPDKERVTFAPARDAAPPGLMDQVRRDFIDPSWVGDTGRMRVAAVQSTTGQEVLYLVDPSVVPPTGAISKDPSLSPLCGSKGCRYLAFTPVHGGEYRKVLDVYLQSLLPPGEEPFYVEKKETGLPCLVVTEFPGRMEGQARTRHRYCYDGQEYRRERTTRHIPPTPR